MSTKISMEAKELSYMITSYELEISRLKNELDNLKTIKENDLNDMEREFAKNNYYKNGETNSI